MGVKIIFLDIDGVLINRAACMKGFGVASQRCVRNLNHLTDETGALIVLSSCWRIGRSVIECRELLQRWNVTGKMLDRTPNHYELTRGKEIQEWLNTNQDIDSFVILDDDADMEPYMDRLVQTKFTWGLTKRETDRAKEILSSKTSRQDESRPGCSLASKGADYPTAESGFESLAAQNGGTE